MSEMKINDFEKDSNDPLWDLLGNAKPVEVSPFFSRNVLREIRKQEEVSCSKRLFDLGWFRRWRLTLIGASSFVIVLLNTNAIMKHRTRNSSFSIRPGDKEVISHLDELLASDDSSVWLDNSGPSD